MSMDSWDDCIEENISRKVSPDRAKAEALRDVARGRIEFLDTLGLNERSAEFMFEGYYSSMLELVHASAISIGFSIGNHVCLGYYIKDRMGREDMFRLFDNCRERRNRLVYYGKRMRFEIAKDAIVKSKRLISEFSK